MAGEWSPPESNRAAPGELDSLGTLIATSWERLKAQPGPAVVGMALGMAILTVAMVLWYGLLFGGIMLLGALGAVLTEALSVDPETASGLVALLTVLFSVICFPLLLVAMMPGQLIMLRGGLMTAREEPLDMSGLFDRIGRLSLVGTALVLLMTLALIPAALLLYIPAIYLGLRWSVALHLLMDEPDLGAVDALRRSWRITEGRVLDLFIKHFAFGLLSSLVTLCTCYLGMFVILPLQMVFVGQIYLQLTAREAGASAAG